MIYCFFSAVCITLFLTTGCLALIRFLEHTRAGLPLTWAFHNDVVILALLCALFFVLAVCLGFQIPNCYVA